MYKTQIKVINSKDGNTKHFWGPNICQCYINTFHMVPHSIIVVSHEMNINFHVLYTTGEKTQCGKDWKILNKFISFFPVHTCRRHFSNSFARMAMGMSLDQ